MPRKSKKPKVLKGRRGRSGGGGGFPKKATAPTAVANVYITPGYGSISAYGDISNMGGGGAIATQGRQIGQPKFYNVDEEHEKHYYTDVRGSREQYITAPWLKSQILGEPQIPTDRPSMETQTDNTKTTETQTTGQQTNIIVPQRPNISAREEASYYAFPIINPGTVPIVGDEDTTNAEYMRLPQMIPEQTTKITEFYKPVGKPNFEESARILQEQEAEAALARPIRTPRAAYDYSAITEDDISRVEIATQSNNPKEAEKKLKLAIQRYENSNKKQYMSARQALDEYLAKVETQPAKK